MWRGLGKNDEGHDDCGAYGVPWRSRSAEAAAGCGVCSCTTPIERTHRTGGRARHAPANHGDRKSGVEGKRGDLGGRRIIKKKKRKKARESDGQRCKMIS